ncbi:MAG TPA: GNAT family N-acetyltransferase [Anaerolineales bacterium]|nr:GNAT family N-acetyltransferase [Anaerolineales bacterium]
MFTQQQSILRDLGKGLIMRRATPEDAYALSKFNGDIHGEDEVDRKGVMAWTSDLLTRPHATFQPGDFTIVEETATGRIVSSLNLISQTWSYQGIEFGVGRPELVGTLPEFRGRGLIRAQFEEVHKWSADRGELVQAITGIPYYYRQFGYEFALNLGGWRMGLIVPKLKEGEMEKFVIRPADKDDIPLLMSLYEYGCRRSMLSAQWTAAHWYNNLFELSEENFHRLEYRILERADTREPVGYFGQTPLLGSTGARAFHYELAPGVSWLEVSPCVVRYMWDTGQEYAKRENRTCTTFSFLLGAEHPVYEALGNTLPRISNPYAWYLRVPDLLGFLNLIKPVLEQRLSESIACGHTGEYLLVMYPQGIRLTLENGHIDLDSWKPDNAEDGNAVFPMLTFLQILFGYRSFEELDQAFPDCYWRDESTHVIINALFPKKNSHVFGIV